jgi:glycosidase
MYSAYHGYWPSDPTQTESCFGTKQELIDLVTAAHAKNLKVIFDYAMVHVQINSTVYSAHNDWFWPNSNNGKDCICGQGCDWNADAQRCWFTSYLPHWNYTNAAARDFSVGNAVQLALDTKVDGFRLDAIKHVDISWLTELRGQITSQITALQTPKQRFYMVGETYDFGNRDFIKSFVDTQSKLDGQFDFPLRANVVNTILLRNQKMSDLAAFMGGNDYFYGGDAVMSTFIGNHDLPRVIHLAQNSPLWSDQASDGKDRSWSNQPGLPSETEAYERLANAFGLLLTNRGAPLIYYGDEIAMPGGGDPDNRRMMTFTGWSANQTFVHDRIAKLNAIRAAHPALRRGTRSNISVDDDAWVFVRSTTGDNVWVGINRSDNDKPVSGLPAGSLQELVTNTVTTGPNVTIPARQTRIFVQK